MNKGVQVSVMPEKEVRPVSVFANKVVGQHQPKVIPRFKVNTKLIFISHDGVISTLMVGQHLSKLGLGSSLQRNQIPSLIFEV